MKFVEVEETEFEDFSEKSEATNFLQSLEMYHRYLDRGNEAYLVGVKDGKTLKAAALLVSKTKVLNKKVFISPRGFLADFKAKDFEEVLKTFTDGAKKFLKNKNGGLLEISPKISRVAKVDDDGVPTENMRGSKETKLFEKYGYKNLGEYEFIKWAYVLPMKDLTEENLMKHFRKGHREAIRFSTTRYGVRLKELKTSELKILKALTDDSARRHGFITPDIKYYEEMKKAYGKKVRFLVAEAPKTVIDALKNGESPERIKKAALEAKETDEFIPVAGAMFVIWKNEIVYLFSGQAEDYRKLGGPHFLQFIMIKEAIKQKIPEYNFYGTDPKKKDGVYEFKRGYHGELQEYIGTFMLPLSIVGRLFLLKQKYEDVRDIH